MAQHVQFLGFKRVLTGATMQDNYLYFERVNASATEGKIWFNGTCYGSCRDTEVDAINEVLAEFLNQTGETKTVKEYIDEAVATITSGMTTSVELDEDAFSGLTLTDKSETPGIKDYVIDLQNVAPDDEFRAEIQDRQDADAEINAELDAVEGSLGFNGTAYTNSGNYISGDTVAADISRLDTVLGELNDNLSDVESELATTAATLSNMIDAEEQARQEAIEALDYSGVTEDGRAIVNVTETDGKIVATQGDIAASHVTIADTASTFDATNVEDALAELAAKVSSNEVEIEQITPCGDTYASSYILKDATGKQLGDAINVAKDQFLKEAYLSGQTLYLVMYTESGSTTTIEVDFSEMIIEAEAGDGLYMGEDHSLNVGKGANSEDFLVINANDIEITGVTAAIEAAVAAEAEAREDADDEIESALTLTAQTLVEMIENAQASATTEVVEGEDNEHLSIEESTEADGHKKYTVTLTDVASATALTAEENAREAADADLATAITAEATARENADNALQAELDAVEAAVGLTTGGTLPQFEGEYVSAATSVTSAIEALNDALTGSNNAWEEALAAEASARTQADNEEASARTQADEALEDAIEAEATARTAADQALAEDIADEASARTQADEALDARLDVIEPIYVTAITVNDVEGTVVDHVADVTIDAKDIILGEEVTGTTGGVHFDSGATTTDVFQDIVDVLNRSVAGSYTGVTSNDGSISLTPQTNGQDLAVNVKTLQLSDVQAGETEIKKDATTGALYGTMYWIDEEE